MKFTVLTLFPNIINSFFTESILKRAQQEKKITINILNIRDFSKNKHKKVDDVPYGGGGGMLLTCQPLFDAIKQSKQQAYKKHLIIYLSPTGKKITQTKIEKLMIKYEELILVCGHYEGIDQRIRDNYIDLELSLGDYVLTGGELGAAVIIDAVSRLIPNVLGDKHSFLEESFSKKLNRKKEYPHYTRPPVFKGLKVPEILLSGDHKKIKEWRQKNIF